MPTTLPLEFRTYDHALKTAAIVTELTICPCEVYKDPVQTGVWRIRIMEGDE